MATYYLDDYQNLFKSCGCRRVKYIRNIRYKRRDNPMLLIYFGIIYSIRYNFKQRKKEVENKGSRKRKIYKRRANAHYTRNPIMSRRQFIELGCFKRTHKIVFIASSYADILFQISMKNMERIND